MFQYDILIQIHYPGFFISRESETYFLKWSQSVKKDNNKNLFGMYILYIDCYVDDLGEVDEMDDLGFAEKNTHCFLWVIFESKSIIIFFQRSNFLKSTSSTWASRLWGFACPDGLGQTFFCNFLVSKINKACQARMVCGNKGFIDNYYGYHVRKTKRNLGGPKGFGWNKRNLGGLNEIG